MHSANFELITERTILRQWKESDLPTWIALNQDPEVMRYFERPLSADESIATAQRISHRISEDGWGLWALEIKGGPEFVGFVGLSQQDLGLPFTPCVEIGWRLTKSAWGNGYATEAAKAALAFGLQRFDAIYSFTAATNLPSRKVMERIGLVERTDLAFEHPKVNRPEIKAHVVYSICSRVDQEKYL